LERPIDVKFGPDGALYILDYGQMYMKDGQEKVTPGTGRIWKVVPVG
jgi:glucose/arabinose dehydrogenase